MQSSFAIDPEEETQNQKKKQTIQAMDDVLSPLKGQSKTQSKQAGPRSDLRQQYGRALDGAAPDQQTYPRTAAGRRASPGGQD